jgi:trehalose synthase
MPEIKEYAKYVGNSVIDELELYAAKLKNVTVQNINSTAVGGGVAEILINMIPLLQELGINAKWDVIKGGEKFFEITKKMHNALHGQKGNFSQEEIDNYLETNESNANQMNLHGDIIYIHDPQPCALVKQKQEVGGKWIWRCHIDFSRPDQFIKSERIC